MVGREGEDRESVSHVYIRANQIKSWMDSQLIEETPKISMMLKMK